MQGDASGYDVLVIDAMHKANFASRLCHSCRPNCEAKYDQPLVVSNEIPKIVGDCHLINPIS